ncbi:MAG: hypothetical protein NTZ59_14300 [Bacteroidetes bacterium]|nr:hypothetical protein [Bacteroidota bacterium]
MENKIIKATNQRPVSNHIIDASIVNIDILTFIKQIKNETAWKENDRNAITVFKTNGLSIVLIALHQNAEMTKHKTNELMSIQMLEGEIEFSTNDESFSLKDGQMIAAHSRLEHSILALQESVFLLTVTTSTKQFID